MLALVSTGLGPSHLHIAADEGLSEEPALGSLDRIDVDGVIQLRPFALGLARLARWQSWLRVGGELVVHADCPWAIDRLRRTLVGLGFRIARCVSEVDGDEHRTTISAIQTKCPAAEGAERVVRSMLRETYDEPTFTESWRGAQLSLRGEAIAGASSTIRHDSAITFKKRTGGEVATGAAAEASVEATEASAEVIEPSAETAPLVSIIMLTFNALDDTVLCLAALEANTHVSYELILVDNASTDGTPAHLRQWAATRPHARLVLNHENTGFAGGNNLGMALAKGRYLMLLNNDTVVTAGWLERLLDVCQRHPDVGLVGPRSNCVSGAQLVQGADYTDLAGLESYAARWTHAHQHESRATRRLVGFCLLVKRELMDVIGGLDPRFGRGNFEDDDYCLRAAAAGFGARIAHDVFIHHSGSKSFRAANIDYREALETNWRIFKAKWGIADEQTLEQGYPNLLSPPEQAMQFINLPEINVSHREDTPERIFEQRSVTAEPTFVAADGKVDVAALFDEAEATAQRGDWPRAVKLFAEMVRKAPTFGPGYVALASAAFATGQVDAGVVALEHACTMYPDNADLRMQLGVAFAHTGQLELAEKAFLQVLDIDVEHIDAIVSLAQLCRASRNYVEAVDLLDHASKLAPTSPVVLGAIGATAFELGDRAGATVAFQHLRANAPDHPETAILAQTLGVTL